MAGFNGYPGARTLKAFGLAIDETGAIVPAQKRHTLYIDARGASDSAVVKEMVRRAVSSVVMKIVASSSIPPEMV